MKASLHLVQSSRAIVAQHQFLDQELLNVSSSSGTRNMLDVLNGVKHGGKEIFLMVNESFVVQGLVSERVYKLLSNDSRLSNSEINFAVQEEFIRNFMKDKLSFRFPVSIEIRMVEKSSIPILEQVIVQPLTSENVNASFIREWIEENEFDFPSLVKKQVSTLSTRFHIFSITDDINIDFQIVDTKLQRQGIIDSERTKFIILTEPGVALHRKLHTLSGLQDIMLDNIDDSFDDILTSDFICNKTEKSVEIEQVHHVTTNILLSILKNHSPNYDVNSKEDPHSMLLVSANYFAKLNCMDKIWGRVNSSHSVLITLVHGEDLPYEGAIMTNALYFNLGRPNKIQLTSNIDAPKTASKVILTPVQSPNHFGTTLISGTEEEQRIEQRLFEKQLDIYFSSKSRVLRKHEIIMVNNPTISFIKSDDSMQVQVLAQLETVKRIDPLHADYTCYRVDSVEVDTEECNDSVFVSPSETTLITNAQPLRGYIPAEIPLTDYYELNVTKQLSRFIEPIISIYKQFPQGNSAQKSLVQQHFLLYGEEGSGKTIAVHSVCAKYGFHLLEINAFEIINESDSITAQNLSQCFTLARQCTPCILYVKHFEAFDQLSNSSSGGGASVKQHSKIRIVKCLKQCLKPKNNSFPLIFIPSVSSLDLLSPVFKNLFLTKIEARKNLNEEAREQFIQKAANMSQGSICNIDISASQIVKLTSGCSIYDLNKIIQISKSQAITESMNTQNELRKDNGNSSSHPHVYLSTLSHKHIVQGGLKWHKKYAASVSGSNVSSTTNVSIPTVNWQDIGGLEHAKQEILDIIQSPIQSHNLKSRSGVLLYGPPGCGKTLLAKAVATECQLNFMSVKGPELINMYVGESERNVRLVFEKARQCKPCVIFFDELDALAPNRGASGDSGGVMDRVVSQLLAELDDIGSADGDEESDTSNKGVFVIGATNRPDLIDPALLRPGRFERLVYLGVSKSREEQLKVLKALTRKFSLKDNVDFEKLLEQSGFNLTGADFYAICTDAFMNAVSRATSQGDISQKQSHQIVVCHEDFEKAFKNITPSVSVADLERYESLQGTFKK
ncbi:hypothetical protein C9374_013298 [Naegleria lovaniensis]|uniref:Peroxisomal ATPase PEX6 n=1 Tax=Naegleria lovaniensis TaxID=51637 RepID=A0AA88GZ28_NAELO|nr:Peroxin 6 (Pex6), putative [Naegleria lovaniensis]KAG2391813.1 hypothetical protein C9374_013298 [Naegleria lovaniensis]